MEKPQIILASASIGRKTLLEKLGVPFKIVVSEIDEDKITHANPYKMLENRARAKAEDVSKMLAVGSQQLAEKSSVNRKLPPANYLILAADSMAILNGKPFGSAQGKTYGKAKNRADAKRIITELMGKTHDFVTATYIIHLKFLKQLKSLKELNRWDEITTTKVTCRHLPSVSLSHYVSRYDFTRFAAGYALNETPWDLVTKIDGSYTNVIGLPFEVILPIFRELHLL